MPRTEAFRKRQHAERRAYPGGLLLLSTDVPTKTGVAEILNVSVLPDGSVVFSWVLWNDQKRIPSITQRTLPKALADTLLKEILP